MLTFEAAWRWNLRHLFVCASSYYLNLGAFKCGFNLRVIIVDVGLHATQSLIIFVIFNFWVIFSFWQQTWKVFVSRHIQGHLVFWRRLIIWICIWIFRKPRLFWGIMRVFVVIIIIPQLRLIIDRPTDWNWFQSIWSGWLVISSCFADISVSLYPSITIHLRLVIVLLYGGRFLLNKLRILRYLLFL